MACMAVNEPRKNHLAGSVDHVRGSRRGKILDSARCADLANLLAIDEQRAVGDDAKLPELHSAPGERWSAQCHQLTRAADEDHG